MFTNRKINIVLTITVAITAIVLLTLAVAPSAAAPATSAREQFRSEERALYNKPVSSLGSDSFLAYRRGEWPVNRLEALYKFRQGEWFAK